MSGIIGVFDLAGGPVDVDEARRMAGRQRWRGGPATDTADTRSAFLGVSRFDWELSPDLSGDVLVLDDGRYVVAADACLFYRRELESRLLDEGAPVTGNTPSHLILAAYKAWGVKCAEHLDGMFAFVIHDRQTGTVYGARDRIGSRPLYFARFGPTLILASSIGAVLEHRKATSALDPAAIAIAAAGWSMCNGAGTCYPDVRVVLNAHWMLWVDGRERTRRYWEPPALDSTGATGYAEAAEELRELLARSVSEFRASGGCTTVWMSGGRDSTAVFAAGQYALSREAGGSSLRPVSISYPEGDLGREDELIQAVADRWNSPPHWIDIDTIPMFHADAERAATREEPGTSPYENWNVALAAGTRACGARIALEGNGGDQLFRANEVYLSDLLRTGRLVELGRELWAKRSRGKRQLLDAMLVPLLRGPAAAAYARWRKNPSVHHYLEFPAPAWLRRDFIEHHDLVERQVACLPDPRQKSQEAELMRWYLSSPMVSYAYCTAQQRLLEAGVDVRSPLMDRRIIEFAFRRPRHERISAFEDKLLLRDAMRGLIPDHVLAPRNTRTGVTLSYSRRSMRDALPSLFGQLLESPLRLAELGIADAGQIREELDACRRGRLPEFARIALFHAFQAELWLRARLG